MASFEYKPWLHALRIGDATATLNGAEGTDGVFVALIDTGLYTPSDTHEFYSQIAAGIVNTPQEILSKVVQTDGKFNGAGVTFSNVTGETIEAIVFFRKNSGASSTWRLLFYEDALTNVVTGVPALPLTPNGVQINLTWNVRGIF